jgi:hypothetical protein
MPASSQLRTILTFTQIVLYVLLSSKLLRSELLEKYRYFSLLIGFEAFRLILLSYILRPNTNAYAHGYFITAPVFWILLASVLLELFQLTLKDHVGVASIGRKAVTWALIVSAVIASSTLALDLQYTKAESQFNSALLMNFFLLERLIMTSLLVLLLCLVGFLAYFPVPLARNVRVHICVFAVYFAIRTGLSFVRSVFGAEWVPTINVFSHLLGIACLLTWTTLLARVGETTPLVRHSDSESESRLLAQLEAINETLLRSTRK